MNKCPKVFRIGALILSIGVCGCRTVPHSTNKSSAENSAAAAPPASQSDPPQWKIPPRPPEEMKPLEPLEDITKLFRATYASERGQVQRSQGAVILVRFSGATLFRNGQIVETARVIPSEYFNLRYAAHVPFMIFLKLRPLCDSPFDDKTRAGIRDFIAVVKQAEPALAYTKLTEAQLIRQRRILDEALMFLNQTLERGSITVDQLQRYARAASLDLDQNMREAGAAQVDGLHQQMLKWRKQMPEAEWRAIRFIVHGPHQPRGGNAATLYISALLKDAGDGRGYLGESGRLVYREDTSLPAEIASSSPPWEADLQLLAAVDLDCVASEALFSDPDRLSVDIVSDGARARIRQLDLAPLQPIGE